MAEKASNAFEITKFATGEIDELRIHTKGELFYVIANGDIVTVSDSAANVITSPDQGVTRAQLLADYHDQHKGRPVQTDGELDWDYHNAA